MEQENYKGFIITWNAVPEAQFIYGGFGWALRSEVNNNRFCVVIKCPMESDDYKEAVLQRGIERVKAYIDRMDFENGQTYCFWWRQPDGLEEDDCANVSPPPS